MSNKNGNGDGNQKWTQEMFEDMRKDWGNNTLVGWKLIYTNGTEIRSTDMPFNEAPQTGVQVLIKYYKRAKGGYSREIQNGLDMYVLFSEQPLYLDLPLEIKKGENLPSARFDELLEYARADEEIVTQMSEDVNKYDY
jgi:hypothetical protein